MRSDDQKEVAKKNKLLNMYLIWKNPQYATRMIGDEDRKRRIQTDIERLGSLIYQPQSLISKEDEERVKSEIMSDN